MNGPLDDLLLAQALDAALEAERRQPGGADAVIARAPQAAQAELRRMVELAAALQTAGPTVLPHPAYRAEARARLLRAMGAEIERPSVNGTNHHLRSVPMISRGGRRTRWIARTVGGLLAASLAVTATLTASASALPGEPLYGLKQAQEELSVRLAGDDEAHVLALLRRADARLDETARLLDQGRTSEAVESAQRYDQVIQRATTAFVVSLDTNDNPPGPSRLEDQLTQQQARLQSLIQSAPEPARPDLRESLALTERGRELAADPKPVDQTPRVVRPAATPVPVAVAAAVPEPTRVPTATALRPTPTVEIVVEKPREDARDDARQDAREDQDAPVVAQDNGQRGEDANDEHGNPQEADTSASSGPGSGANSGSGRANVPSRAPVAVPAAPAAGQSGQNGSGSDQGNEGGGNDDENGEEVQQTRGGGGDRKDEAPAPVPARPPAPAPVIANQQSGNRGSSGDDDSFVSTKPSGQGQGNRQNAPTPVPQPQTTQQPVRSGSNGEGDGARSTARPTNTPSPTATPTVKRETSGTSGTSGSNRGSGHGDDGDADDDR